MSDSLSLFPTPVIVVDLPDMQEINRELAARLLEERARDRGIQRSNVGGWHSTPDLTLRQDRCYQQLIATILAEVTNATRALIGPDRPQPRFRCGAQAWAMILDDGDYIMPHDHADAHWSTAYYVDAADEGGGGLAGMLAFVDPRRSGRSIPGLQASAFQVRPRTGTLVIFPGWLQHYVHAHRGHRPRISVSCNVMMEALPG